MFKPHLISPHSARHRTGGKGFPPFWPEDVASEAANSALHYIPLATLDMIS
jgi:hypothetical protein